MGKVISIAKTSTGTINKLTFTDGYGQKVNLDTQQNSGFGLQQNNVYIRSNSAFSVYSSGNHTSSGPGVDGKTLMILDENADAVFFGDVTAFYTSDVRLKTNISNLENVLDKVLELTPINYEFKKEKKYDKRKTFTGLIAQEVLQSFPELVVKKQDGYFAIEYDKFVAVLIQAIKELNNKLETLTKDKKE